MNPTRTASDERLISTSLHEASHAVAAVVHDARLDFAEILRSGPATDTQGRSYSGRTRYLWGDDAKPHLDAITAAGAVGEAVWAKGRPTVTDVWRLLQSHAADLGTLTQLSHAKGRNPIAALDTVLPMVHRLWPNIAALATQLRAVREVTHKDVLAALNIPSATDAHRYTRAIRHGGEPGQLHVRGRHVF